jgi:hypothetical protein
MVLVWGQAEKVNSQLPEVDTWCFHILADKLYSCGYHSMSYTGYKHANHASTRLHRHSPVPLHLRHSQNTAYHRGGSSTPERSGSRVSISKPANYTRHPNGCEHVDFTSTQFHRHRNARIPYARLSCLHQPTGGAERDERSDARTLCKSHDASLLDLDCPYPAPHIRATVAFQRSMRSRRGGRMLSSQEEIVMLIAHRSTLRSKPSLLWHAARHVHAFYRSISRKTYPSFTTISRDDASRWAPAMGLHDDTYD